jgi:putative flippase GtrA
MKRIIHWLTAPVDSTLLQVPRALVASVLCTLLDFFLLVFLVETGGWNPLVGAVVTYFAGCVLQYILCAVWIFPSAPHSASFGFAAFSVLALGGLVITWLSIFVFYDLAHLNYALAKILSLVPSFSWNFLSRKYWLFKPGVASRRPTPRRIPDSLPGRVLPGRPSLAQFKGMDFKELPSSGKTR